VIVREIDPMALKSPQQLKRPLGRTAVASSP
jgi:hypothetical protein